MKIKSTNRLLASPGLRQALAVLGVSALPIGMLHAGPFGDASIESSAAGDGSDFNPAAPWIIPAGYVQGIVSDESDLNIYLEPTSGPRSSDWHDMNTVNETGKFAGRYLYRTHEVRGNAERGGAVSVVDLRTGETKILAEDPTYDALDGIVWTPWRTVLFAEETTGGRLLEIELDPKDPSVATAVIELASVDPTFHDRLQRITVTSATRSDD